MYLLIKPASGACNLRCKYCFYTDEMRNREHAVRGIMTDDCLCTVIEKALARAESAEGPGGTLSLGFQGGEPTLAGLDFFRRNGILPVNKRIRFSSGQGDAVLRRFPTGGDSPPAHDSCADMVKSHDRQ